MNEDLNEDFDIDELEKDTQRQLDELNGILDECDKSLASLEKKSYDGVRDVFKYFDRINDKLFNFNNILIAGFFAIGKLKDDVPMWLIIIPILNLGFFIFIEYMIMEKSRMEAFILDNFDENKYRKNINRTNLYSLLTIVATTIVTICFLYNLLK